MRCVVYGYEELVLFVEEEWGHYVGRYRGGSGENYSRGGTLLVGR